MAPLLSTGGSEIHPCGGGGGKGREMSPFFISRSKRSMGKETVPGNLFFGKKIWAEGK